MFWRAKPLYAVGDIVQTHGGEYFVVKKRRWTRLKKGRYKEWVYDILEIKTEPPSVLRYTVITPKKSEQYIKMRLL